MYEIVHTKAIIFLERQDKEYDKVFFIFSEELGLTSVSTPGILKPGAKLNSIIQPFRIVSADVVVGKTTKKMTTVLETLSFEKLFYAPDTKKSLLKVFEFIVALVPRHVEVKDIYTLFETFIKELLLAEDIKTITRLETHVIHKILHILGYDDSDFLNNPTFFDTPNHKKLLHRVNKTLKEINT